MAIATQESSFGRTPHYVLTGGLAIIFLFPLVWSLVASVSPQASTGQRIGYGLGNYTTLYSFGAGLPKVAFNSFYMSVLTVVITLAMSTLGGYAFARFTFWGRDALFLLTLSILMVPFATLIIPLYVLLNAVGLTNSLVGVALIVAMFQLPFATYMMRISFEAIPRELEEVGADRWLRNLWRVVAGHDARGRSRPGYRRAIRLPRGMERILRAADHAYRPRQADASGGGGQSQAADDGRHRLRCDTSRRRGHGAAVRHPVPVAPALLRARLHVGCG